MDWVTLTRQQVENDALPNVCMVCGGSATCCVNKTFTHTPEWVEWLNFAGFFPGLIAAQFFTKELRVPCPLCPKHRYHWQVLYWTAGLGWLIAGLLGAGLGYLAGTLVSTTSSKAPLIGLIAGAVIGIMVALSLLIYLYNTRISVTKMTTEEITLHGVADAFAKAVKEPSHLAKT